jgi:hypothetical protein
MIMRIVCFRFKKGTSEEKIQAHMDHFARFAKEIPVIRSCSGGRVVSGEKGAPPEYHSAHYLTFAREEDLDVYFNHPAHLDFIEKHKAIWEPGVLVLNAKAE